MEAAHIERTTVKTCAECGVPIHRQARRCTKCNGSDPEMVRRRNEGWRRKVETDAAFRAKIYGPLTAQRGACLPKRPALERWREGFDVTGECWVWRGAKSDKGYATFRDDNGRKASVHRFAYQQFIGPIPDGLVIDHLCRNPGCCNPAHLEAVTNTINVLRGKRGALRAPQTHCKQGHPYPENERRDKNGHRSCRECARINGRKYDAARRSASR